MIITDENVTEAQAYQFSAFASDLDLSADMRAWPKSIATTLGNKQDFIRRGIREGYARYVQFYGCIELCIFND